MAKTYTLVMRIDARDDVTTDQIWDAVYDLLFTAPFAFDVTAVTEQPEPTPA